MSKFYLATEFVGLITLTTALLIMPGFGGLYIVVPLVVFSWITLQFVSSVAFCNAINKGTISVSQGPHGSKETYGLAEGAHPGFLVMRHVWTYDLFRRASDPAPPTRNQSA